MERAGGTRVLKCLAALMMVLGCLSALSAGSAEAKAAPPIQGSQALTTLAVEARALLNSHLPAPRFQLPIHIGYATGPHEGVAGPADTFPAVDHSFCEIAVDRSSWDQRDYTGGYDGTGNGDKSRALEIITHEAFHCYQLQLIGGRYNDVPSWVREGLPRWVDLSLFPSNPVPDAARALQHYFESPTQSLFTRTYDAVGFWGHLEDVSGSLWREIPRIILASEHGNQATISAALTGVDRDQFFDSWGSSAANPAHGDASWTARSPFPPRDRGASAARPVNTARAPNTQASVKLDPYSTAQLRIDAPTAPNNEIETIRIELNGAYGRFGTTTNDTGAALVDKTFCAATTSCPTITPPSSSCPGATASPTLTPLPADGLLGLAAADEATVHIDYAAIPRTTPCEPSCKGASVHADISCVLPARSCSALLPLSTFPSDGGETPTTLDYGTVYTGVYAPGSSSSDCDVSPADESSDQIPSTLGLVRLISYPSTVLAAHAYGDGNTSLLYSDPDDPFILSASTPVMIGDAASTYSFVDQDQTVSGVGGGLRVDNDLFLFDCISVDGETCPDAASLLTQVAEELG